jgi:hypothetical protein
VGLAKDGAPAGSGTHSKSGAHPYRPDIDPADFRSTVDNPWFPLVPGTTFRYDERVGARHARDVVTVTSERKTILGVACTVVHDVVRSKGAVLEDTWDWYGQDRQGNVWYFGEDTRERHASGKWSAAGSWEAGVDGAQPGIVMVADPRPGPAYRQEYRAGKAEDMGQVEALGDSVIVPCGRYTGCVRTREWSKIESGSERKWYARNVGFVRSESTDHEISVLESVTRP